jgi:hypothetical protein
MSAGSDVVEKEITANVPVLAVSCVETDMLGVLGML